jgi:hypothetical protein
LSALYDEAHQAVFEQFGVKIHGSAYADAVHAQIRLTLPEDSQHGEHEEPRRFTKDG